MGNILLWKEHYTTTSSWHCLLHEAGQKDGSLGAKFTLFIFCAHLEKFQIETWLDLRLRAPGYTIVLSHRISVQCRQYWLKVVSTRLPFSGTTTAVSLLQKCVANYSSNILVRSSFSSACCCLSVGATKYLLKEKNERRTLPSLKSTCFWNDLTEAACWSFCKG